MENRYIGVLPKSYPVAKILLVIVDYFTKWVEAEPVANIIEAQTESFI